MEDMPGRGNEKEEGERHVSQRPPALAKEGSATSGDANPQKQSEDFPAQPKRGSRWSRLSPWLRDLKASDAMMAFLTFVIAGTGVVGIVLVIQGGRDTKRLVDATEKEARAAQRNADAAKSFSESAAKINAGISDAVEKLKSQAAANQTQALAANTANTNTLEADRPWMGASFSVDGFAAGKTPTYTVTFVNSGKRPARVTLTQTLAALFDFGVSPIYRPYDTTPSTSFVVPGQPIAASWRDDEKLNPISDELMKTLNSNAVPFRIYAKIEYTDMRTHAKYWTHACWRYTPSHTAINSGFSNCTEYNDAK